MSHIHEYKVKIPQQSRYHSRRSILRLDRILASLWCAFVVKTLVILVVYSHNIRLSYTQVYENTIHRTGYTSKRTVIGDAPQCVAPSTMDTRERHPIFVVYDGEFAYITNRFTDFITRWVHVLRVERSRRSQATFSRTQQALKMKRQGFATMRRRVATTVSICTCVAWRRRRCNG